MKKSAESEWKNHSNKFEHKVAWKTRQNVKLFIVATYFKTIVLASRRPFFMEQKYNLFVMPIMCGLLLDSAETCYKRKWLIKSVFFCSAALSGGSRIKPKISLIKTGAKRKCCKEVAEQYSNAVSPIHLSQSAKRQWMSACRDVESFFWRKGNEGNEWKIFWALKRFFASFSSPNFKRLHDF